MKYAYEDLSEEQFEQLVVHVCRRLLGMGVQGFSKGADGGRDGKFVGTAQLLPSAAAPWQGTVIIQAKHTNGYNRSCSDSDFFSPNSANTVIGKELPRIQKLRKAQQLDHYIVFTNRRLSAIADSGIKKHLSQVCGIPEPSIMLCGLEQLESWLKEFPDIPKMANLDPVDSPLILSPDDLSQVVEALAGRLSGAADNLNMPPTPRTSYALKNTINNMNADYAKDLRKRYLKDTAPVQKFLAAPENDGLLRLYESVVEEFQLKILSKIPAGQPFNQVMEYLLDLLFKRDSVLRSNKRVTRIVVFYMYWNCDIGKGDDAATD